MNRSQSPLNTSNISNNTKTHDKRYVSPNHGVDGSRSISPSQQLLPPRPQSQNPNQVPINTLTSNPNQSRQSMNSSFQSQNPGSYFYIPCPSHPDLFITNICKTKECVEPLCPECITAHLDMHTNKGGPQARIENIQRVRKECYQVLMQQIDRLKKDSNDLRSHSLGSQQAHYQTCVDSMRQQHQRILDMVDDYFEQMEKELKEKMRGLDQLKKQYQDLDSLVGEDIRQVQYFFLQKQLDNYAAELQGQNYVRLVIQLLEEDQAVQGKKKIQDLEQAIKSYEDQLPIVQIDTNAYDLVRSEMKRVCYISTKQLMNNQQSKLKSDTTLDSIINRPNKHQLDSNGKLPRNMSQILYNESSILPSQSILSHIPEKNLSHPQDLVIDSTDHFNHQINRENRFISSFEEDTKKVHILYLNDQEQKIQTFSLNMEFRIPVNHRQFTSANGMTFITGGVYREKNRFKASDLVYLFDSEEMTLKPQESMNVARAIHGICQVGDQMYVVGGTTTNDENSSQNKVERLDMSSQRWTQLSDCKYKTSGSCLVGYKEKHIIKIGGKLDIFTPCTIIELYDIARDIWTEIDYQFSGAGYLRLPFNACAVDIGRNQILVFGGSVHDVKSNESSIMKLPDQLQGKIQISLTRAIPRASEFSTQVAIIENRGVWVFQDVAGKKKILHCSDSTWKEF